MKKQRFQGGCNPWPIKDIAIDESVISIRVSSIEEMKSVFYTWAWPVK